MAGELADRGAVGDVPDRRDPTQAGDARRRDQPGSVGREMQGGDLPRKLAEQSLGTFGQAPALARRLVERHLGIASDGQPLAVARHVDRDDRANLGVRGNLGHDQGQAVGLFALRGRGLRLRSRLRSRAISPGFGSWLALGRHAGLGRAGQHADHQASLGIARQDRGALLGSLLQRAEGFERELAFAILVVMTAGAVLRENGGDLGRDNRARAWSGPCAVEADAETTARTMSLRIGISPSMIEQELAAAQEAPEDVLDDLSLA